MSNQTVPWITAAAVVLALVTALVYGMTMQRGLGWSDDTGQYIMHAEALMAGTDYADIPYIVNPENPRVGPRVYPPGYPIFLTGPLAIHGADLDLLQVYQVALLALCVGLTVFLALPQLPGALALVPAALTALSPPVWEIKDAAISEPLFMALTLLALLLGSVMLARSGGTRIAWSIPTGLTMAAAFATRTLGIVFFPAWVLFCVVRIRQVGFAAAGAGLVSALILAGLSLLFGNPLADYTTMVDREAPGGIFGILGLATTVIENVPILLSQMSGIWLSRAAPTVLELASVGLMGLAVLGFLIAAVRRFSLMEAFILGYVGLLMVSPLGLDVRRLLPVFPLVMIYLTLGAWSIVQLFPLKAMRGALAAAAVAVPLMLYAYSYAGTSLDKAEHGPRDADAQAMFQTIKSLTEPDEPVVFQKPRLLWFYTGRPATPPPKPGDAEATIAWMETVGARYLVTFDGAPDTDPALFEKVEQFGIYGIYRQRP